MGFKMGSVISINAPPSRSRPKATQTLPTPAKDMWWKSDHPATLVKVLTPEIALHLLDRAGDVNREVKQYKVDQYAHMMTAGLWRPVEQQCDAFAFDIDGRCINGQHRLWAVVESRKTISFEIKIGMPTSAIDTIDDHLKRSDAVQYNLTHGGDISERHMAVAMRLLMARGKPRGGYDRATKYEALERYRKIIDTAMGLVPNTSRVRSLTAASMLAVIARASLSVPISVLQRFIDVLQSGVTSGESEAVAILLRDWMLKNGAGSGPLQTELYWKTERALKAFVDKDVITTLYAANAELFPLPDEIIERRADAVSTRRVKSRAKKKATK